MDIQDAILYCKHYVRHCASVFPRVLLNIITLKNNLNYISKEFKLYKGNALVITTLPIWPKKPC